jgi:hypothetical protein
MRNKQTKEMKVAKIIAQSVNDFDLDLEEVGRYLASDTSATIYNRLYTVAESTKYNKELIYDRTNINPLF